MSKELVTDILPPVVNPKKELVDNIEGPTGPQGEVGPIGPEGPTGPRGFTGERGEQGIQGVKGSTGDQGAHGDIGPAGPTGPTGPTGEDSVVPGPRGLKGDTGAQGPLGAVGPAGPVGDGGVEGVKGDTGPQGPAGIQGIKGDKGDIGQTGSQGQIGATGADGPTGPTGLQGIQGVAGVKGNDGATGPQGLKGDTGTTGATGIQGVKGDTGLTGPQGIQGVKGDTGTTGTSGSDGATGPQGPIGLTGPQGIQGIKGDTGTTGTAGAKGDIGLTGNTGPQGPVGATPVIATTSTTAITPSATDKPFVVPAPTNLVIGQYVRASSRAAPTANYVAGPITAISADGLTITVTAVEFLGARVSDWDITVTGKIGTDARASVTNSTTTNTFGLGSKSFTLTNANNIFVVGQVVRIVVGGDSTRYMTGIVTSNTTGASMTVNVTESVGSGTSAGWTIAPGAFRGDPGMQGPSTVAMQPPVGFSHGATGVTGVLTNAPVYNRQYFVPIDIGPNGWITDAILWNQVTAYSGATTPTFYGGIYGTDPLTGYPDTSVILAQGAASSAVAAGSKAMVFGSPLQLAPGRYWMSFLMGGAAVATAGTMYTNSGVGIAFPISSTIAPGTNIRALYISSATTLVVGSVAPNLFALDGGSDVPVMTLRRSA